MDTRTSNAMLELTAEQAARALDLQEDCRQLPRWASRTIVRLQDRVAELERAAAEPRPGAEDDALVVWVLERLENCQEIAAKKTGADRDGWLDDAQQFAEILRRLACGAAQPQAAVPDQNVEKLVWAQKAYEDGKKYLDDGGGQMIHVRQNRALGILFDEVQRLEKLVYLRPAQPPRVLRDAELIVLANEFDQGRDQAWEFDKPTLIALLREVVKRSEPPAVDELIAAAVSYVNFQLRPRDPSEPMGRLARAVVAYERATATKESAP